MERPFVTKQFAMALIRFADEAVALSKQLESVDELTSEYARPIDRVMLLQGKQSLKQMTEFTPVSLSGVYTLLCLTDIDLVASYCEELKKEVVKLVLEYPHTSIGPDTEVQRTLYMVPTEDLDAFNRYMCSQILTRSGRWHRLSPYVLTIPDMTAEDFCAGTVDVVVFAPGGVNIQLVPVWTGDKVEFIQTKQEPAVVTWLTKLARKKNDKAVR